MPELALIRGCTEGEAALLALESLVVVERLPDVWGELYEGRLDVRRARVLVDLLGEVPAATAAAVLDRVLPRAGQQTGPQLRDRTRRASRSTATPWRPAAARVSGRPTSGCRTPATA